MNIVISVIMPFYNVDAYIYRAVMSILNQTFQDFEIICIDDASTDFSYDIVTKLAKKDNRISLIKNDTHQGIGVSRTLGIQKAQGKYIAFLDADDWIDEDYLEKVYLKAQEKKCDIVVASIQKVFPDRTIKPLKKHESRQDVFHNGCHNDFYLPLYPFEFLACLYKKSYVIEKQIAFSHITEARDFFDCQKDLFDTPNIAFMGDTFYHYYQRPDATSQGLSEAKASCIVQYFYKQFEFLKKTNLAKESVRIYSEIAVALLLEWRIKFIYGFFANTFYEEYNALIKELCYFVGCNDKECIISEDDLKNKKYYLFGFIPLGKRKIR